MSIQNLEVLDQRSFFTPKIAQNLVKSICEILSITQNNRSPTSQTGYIGDVMINALANNSVSFLSFPVSFSATLDVILGMVNRKISHPAKYKYTP
jgi:hypothetical protein